jgi:hypothetical protein
MHLHFRLFSCMCHDRVMFVIYVVDLGLLLCYDNYVSHILDIMNGCF